MSRWICIDDICIPSDENDWEELVAFADAIAEQKPMELIRCGECKYTEFCEKKIHRHGIAYSIDYCSYGEAMQVMYYPQVDGITPSVIGNSSEKPNNCEDCKWWEEDTSFCYSKADSDDHACHYERSSE